MTLDEIVRTLPNGFHDSEIRGLTVSYERRVAEIEVTFDFSSPDGPAPDPPARDAKVVLRGLKYLVIDPPGPNYPFADAGSLWVDECDSKGSDAAGRRLVSPDLLAASPHQLFATSFFVNDWNSFIHVAADEAELIWAEEKSDKQ